MRKSLTITLALATLAVSSIFALSPVSARSGVTRHATKTVNIIRTSGGNFAFSPLKITVKRGTKVIWHNISGTDHTVTINSKWQISDIPSGARRSLTLRKLGVIKYHCAFHPAMRTAQITVKR